MMVLGYKSKALQFATLCYVRIAVYLVHYGFVNHQSAVCSSNKVIDLSLIIYFSNLFASRSSNPLLCANLEIAARCYHISFTFNKEWN